MTTTPTLRDADTFKNMVRGAAMNQMHILKSQMRLGNLNTGSREVHYSTGLIIRCVKNYSKEDILVTIPEGVTELGTMERRKYLRGFICKPSETLSTYDDSDNDATRSVLVYSDGVWNEKSGATQIIETDMFGSFVSRRTVGDLFGNIDWKGPKDTSGKDPEQLLRPVLTWKGPPSRYWPLDQFADIDGVTVIDHITETLTGDLIYTTPFTENIYEHGSIAATMPEWYWPNNSSSNCAQVLGAAYRKSDGRLFCAVKTCYLNDPKPAVKRHSYFIEIITPGTNGWESLLQIDCGAAMPTTCWFFSEDGTKACSVLYGVLYKVTIAVDDDGIFTATYTTEEVGKFSNEIETIYSTTQTNDDGITITPGMPYKTGLESGQWKGKNTFNNTYSSTKSGKVILAADYKENTLVKMYATLTGDELYTFHRIFGTKWGEMANMNSLYAPHIYRVPILVVNSHPYDQYGTVIGDLCIGAVNVCKPVYSASAGTPIGNGCFDFASMPNLERDPCHPTDGVMNVTVSVVDEASGLTASHDLTYIGAMLPRNGLWKAVNYYEGSYSSGCDGYAMTAYVTIYPDGTINCLDNAAPTNFVTYRSGAIRRDRNCNWETAALPDGTCGLTKTPAPGYNYFWQHYHDWEYWCSETIRGW